MPGLVDLFPVEFQRPVRPSLQEGSGGPVFLQTASQNEDVVLVFIRFVGGDDDHGDDGADDHAFKVQIHGGEEIGKHIPDHHIELGAGDIEVRPPQKHDAAHHQHRQDDPQDVDEPPALMPDQRDVGDAQCQGEQQHEGRGEEHEGLGRTDEQTDEVCDLDVRFIGPEVAAGDQEDHLQQIHEHQDGEARVVDGVVGIGIIPQLPEEGADQHPQHRQVKYDVHREEPGDGDGLPREDHGHPDNHEHGQERDVPHRGLFIQSIKTMKHGCAPLHDRTGNDYTMEVGSGQCGRDDPRIIRSGRNRLGRKPKRE